MLFRSSERKTHSHTQIRVEKRARNYYNLIWFVFLCVILLILLISNYHIYLYIIRFLCVQYDLVIILSVTSISLSLSQCCLVLDSDLFFFHYYLWVVYISSISWNLKLEHDSNTFKQNGEEEEKNGYYCIFTISYLIGALDREQRREKTTKIWLLYTIPVIVYRMWWAKSYK